MVGSSGGTGVSGDVVLETDAGGAALASYVLGGPELLSQTRSGSPSYYLADTQGSTRALTSSAGAVTDTYEYTAFGEVFAKTGATTNPYLYTGQQFDTLTGLYSLRARYYDPGLGRFLSRDPLEVQVFNPVEINRYAYAANNPGNLADPTGKGSPTVEYTGIQTKVSAPQPTVWVVRETGRQVGHLYWLIASQLAIPAALLGCLLFCGEPFPVPDLGPRPAPSPQPRPRPGRDPRPQPSPVPEPP